jgi:hypothetical protein
MELRRYDEAIVYLSSISPNFSNIDTVYWYLALAHIQLNQKALAIQILNQIKDRELFPVEKLLHSIR